MPGRLRFGCGAGLRAIGDGTIAHASGRFLFVVCYPTDRAALIPSLCRKMSRNPSRLESRFSVLHAVQEAASFSHVKAPPLIRATMWSTCVLREPQYAHGSPSSRALKSFFV